MQISKINSVNFKGLWETRQTDAIRFKDQPPVFHREMIYHPFKNETPDDIKTEMEEQSKKNVWGVYDRNYDVDHYVVTQHILGSRLNISEEDYEKLQSMNREGYPISEDCSDSGLNYVAYVSGPTNFEESLELI